LGRRPHPAAGAAHITHEQDDNYAQGRHLAAAQQGTKETGEYRSAIASYQQALPPFRSVGSEFDEAGALCELGAVRRPTADCAFHSR